MCFESSGETDEWNAPDEEIGICDLQRERTNCVLVFWLIVGTFNFCDDQSRPCRKVTLLSKPIFHVVAQRHSGYFCPDLHQSVADRQRIVEHTRIREVAHAETVHPLQRAGVPLAILFVLHADFADKHMPILLTASLHQTIVQAEIVPAEPRFADVLTYSHHRDTEPQRNRRHHFRIPLCLRSSLENYVAVHWCPRFASVLWTLTWGSRSSWPSSSFFVPAFSSRSRADTLVSNSVMIMPANKKARLRRRVLIANLNCGPISWMLPLTAGRVRSPRPSTHPANAIQTAQNVFR